MFRYVHKNAGDHGVQKRELDPLELELQVVVSLQVGILGRELRASGKGVQALDLCSISPAPYIFLIAHKKRGRRMLLFLPSTPFPAPLHFLTAGFDLFFEIPDSGWLRTL